VLLCVAIGAEHPAFGNLFLRSLDGPSTVNAVSDSNGFRAGIGVVKMQRRRV